MQTPKIGDYVNRFTYSRHRGIEKVVRLGKDLGRPCFYTESGKAYRTEYTLGKGFLNSGNAAFWAVPAE